MSNKALTIALKKNEITVMMKRVAKCDKRIDAGISGIVGQESEVARKERLLAIVTERLQEIAALTKDGG